MAEKSQKTVAGQRSEAVFKSHRETVIDRMQRDRAFCAAILDELRDALKSKST